MTEQFVDTEHLDRRNRRLIAIVDAMIRDRLKAFTNSVGQLDLSKTTGVVGNLPTTSGGTGGAAGGEPPLGNPTADGQALVSTVAGVRSWATIVAGLTVEQIQDLLDTFIVVGAGLTKTYDDAANTLTIAATGGGATTETFGLVYRNDGSVALRGDGTLVTKRIA